MRQAEHPQRWRNGLTAGIAAIAVTAMLGLAFASAPLYGLFCRVTGYGGTPKVAAGKSASVGDRVIKVRFNADTAPDMPWRFAPLQREVRVKVGENGLAFFRAENRSGRPISGQAGYNVTPLKAGAYFNKVECFCFSEQHLEPGQVVDMPVSFFVDPAIAENRNLDDVAAITLSYVFYRLDEAAGPVTSSRRANPQAGVN